MAYQRDIEAGTSAGLPGSEARVIAIKLPAALSQRLDVLVQQTESAEKLPSGDTVRRRGTSRQELVAALILDAPTRKRDLLALLRRYTEANVGDATLPRRHRGVARLPGRDPGSRPTSDQEPFFAAGQPLPRRGRPARVRRLG